MLFFRCRPRLTCYRHAFISLAHLEADTIQAKRLPNARISTGLLLPTQLPSSVNARMEPFFRPNPDRIVTYLGGCRRRYIFERLWTHVSGENRERLNREATAARSQRLFFASSMTTEAQC
jgi:hypothetical protein